MKSPCTACDKPARTLGYCPRHYAQVRRYGCIKSTTYLRKLCPDDARAIHALAAGGKTHRAIAEAFSISRSMVSGIVGGHRYKRVWAEVRA